MKIEIRTLNIGRNSWVHPFISEYQKKIQFFNPIEFNFIKNEEQWLRGVDLKHIVIICDERGEDLTSRGFAKNLERNLASGKQRLFFMVGGPFGLPKEVKKRADKSVRLSTLVFNQEVAIAVLMEQIFRAFTIINNHPYHND